LETKWTGVSAARYDESRFATPAGRLFAHTRERAYIQLLDLAPPGKAIEMAAGTGLVTQYLLEHGFDVVATDASEDMLQQLKRRITELGLKKHCEIRTENAFSLSQPSGAFDLAVCIGLLTWVDSPAKLRLGLQEAARVLKPGGYYLFNYCNHSSPQLLFSRRRGYRRSEIRSLMDETGFDIVATRNGSHFRLRQFRHGWALGKLLLMIDRVLAKLRSTFVWQVYVLARKRRTDGV